MTGPIAGLAMVEETDAPLADRIYQALTNTTAPWGGCHERSKVEAILAVVYAETERALREVSS